MLSLKLHPLSKHPLFAALQGRERRLIYPFVEKIGFNAGETVSERWPSQQWSIYLHRGVVDLWYTPPRNQSKFVIQLEAGALCSLGSFASENLLRVVCKEDCHIMLLPRLALGQLSDSNSTFGRKLGEQAHREDLLIELAMRHLSDQATREVLELVIRRARRLTIPAKKQLSRRGDLRLNNQKGSKPSHTPGFILLTKGCVVAESGRNQTLYFEEGDYFGIDSLRQPADHNAQSKYVIEHTLQTAKESEALLVSRDDNSSLVEAVLRLPPCQPHPLRRRGSQTADKPLDLVDSVQEKTQSAPPTKPVGAQAQPQSEATQPLQDRRNATRHNVQNFDIAIEFSGSGIAGNGTLIDVSESGVFLRSDITCAPGTPVRLRLPSRQKLGSILMEKRGVVARVSPIGFAIKFSALDDSWNDFVEKIAAHKGTKQVYQRYRLGQPPTILNAEILDTVPGDDDTPTQLRIAVQNISMTGAYITTVKPLAVSLVGRHLRIHINSKHLRVIQAVVVRQDDSGGCGIAFKFVTIDERSALSLWVLDLKNQPDAQPTRIPINAQDIRRRVSFTSKGEFLRAYSEQIAKGYIVISFSEPVEANKSITVEYDLRQLGHRKSVVLRGTLRQALSKGRYLIDLALAERTELNSLRHFYQQICGNG